MLTIFGIFLVLLIIFEFSPSRRIEKRDLEDRYRLLLEFRDGLDPRDAIFKNSESWEAHYIVNALLIR